MATQRTVHYNNLQFFKLFNSCMRRPGFNFTNVLRAAFTLADPKSAKKLLNLTVFFALLGSMSAKAARRTLVKLTPGEETDTTVTLETTPSSANITPSHSGDLTSAAATLNSVTTSSCDENSVSVTRMTQSQQLPSRASPSPLSSVTR